MSNESLFIDAIKISLNKGDEVVFIAKGNSMLPFIRPLKDVVSLEPICKEKLTIGDIVLFDFNGHPILHRIVNIQNDIIILRGDGNTRCYENCYYTNIIGRVKSIKRGRLTIDRNSFISKAFLLCWPKKNRLRSFLLNLYKYFNRKYSE